MKTKLELVIDPTDWPDLALDSDSTDNAVIDAAAERLGLNGGQGGWVWRITRPKDNDTIKLVGRYVPAGGHVLS